MKGTVHIPEASRDTVDDDEVEYTVKVEDRKTDRRSQEDAAYDALKGGLRTFLRETFGTIDKELLARANGGVVPFPTRPGMTRDPPLGSTLW